MAYGGDRSGNAGLDNGDVSNPSCSRKARFLMDTFLKKMTEMEEKKKKNCHRGEDSKKGWWELSPTASDAHMSKHPQCGVASAVETSV